MTIKQAFEYLASECGIGMKNPFIALRNLVEGFGKVADEIDPMPTGDYVKKSGDTMTGPLTVENNINCESSDLTAGWVYSTAYSFKGSMLGGRVDLISRATLGDPVQIEVPQKNGTMALKTDYSTAEKDTGLKWTDGKNIYQKTIHIDALPSVAGTETSYAHGITNVDKFIKYEGVAHWSSGAATMLPYFAITSSIDSTSAIACYIGSANIQITVGKDRHDMDADITLFYTKATT